MTTDARGELLGHPKGLFILFFAEMWERFSFYGMKALLILYMVNYLFWKQSEASEVFAWYAGLVYATPILGGIAADKWLGARWSVVIGGVIIAIGHFLLAFEPMPFFYSGLGCLIIGTGFLKPNISTQVGALYRANDTRRDSAFTLFYMGINTGAFFGPIICGWLQLYYSYHHGFAAAGVGMVLGLIVYIAGMKTVVERERLIAAEDAAAGDARPDEPGAFVTTGPSPGISKVYRDRAIALVVICIFAILFWVGFEQAANVMNLWADQHTNLHVFQGTPPPVQLPGEAPSDAGAEPWRMSAAQTQSINPMFVISMAALFSWLWIFLDRRGKQPSTPMKMGIAMVFLAGAFGVMLMAVNAESRATSAPLAAVPTGLSVDEQGEVYSEEPVDDKTVRTDYGATRLTWENGRLQMKGVLPDLDWMRALAASAHPSYHAVIGELRASAATKEEAAKIAKSGEVVETQVSIPPEAGEIMPIAGWPTTSKGEARVEWDASARVLKLKGTLSDRDEAQLLAAGADRKFRDALTAIYKQSSTNRVSIGWLLLFYLVLTIGELCLSPVGLSLVTKAAPPKYVGLFMGLWFFCTGFIANFAAHKIGGYWGTMTPDVYFMIFGGVGVGAAVLMLLMLKALKPMLHGVH